MEKDDLPAMPGEGAGEATAPADTAPPCKGARKKIARPLSDQVWRFVREYARDPNRDATAAAARSGYSRNNAPHWAAMTLRRPEVQAAIKDELALLAARAQPVTERIKDELMRIAFSNPGRIARWKTSGIALIDSEELTDDDRAAVKRITLGPALGKGKQRAQLFEMHDKLGALELLARINGMLPRGGKTARVETRAKRDANAILRERLLKIAQQAEGPSTAPSRCEGSAQDEVKKK